MSIWLSVLALALSVAATTLCALTYLRGRRADKEEKKERALVAGIFAEQREEIAMLDARNARLHEDAKRMRDRLPQPWTCPVEGHTKVRWAGNVGFCAGYGCHHNSLEPAVDEDVSRPYIPTYETQQLLEQYGPKAIWPETTYEATYGPVPEAGKGDLR